jgi:hypothetical protein
MFMLRRINDNILGLFVLISLFLCCMADVLLPASFAYDKVMQLSARSDETSLKDEKISLRWKDLGSEITYLFQMAKDRQFQQIYYEGKSERPEIILRRPEKSGSYYVRIGFIAPDVRDVYFMPLQILEVRGDILPPNIIKPEELSEVRGRTNLSIEWQKVSRAAVYHVILAKDRQFKHIVLEDTAVSATSVTVGNIDYGAYFLKIRSVSNEGMESPFSESRAFIVVPH